MKNAKRNAGGGGGGGFALNDSYMQNNYDDADDDFGAQSDEDAMADKTLFEKTVMVEKDKEYNHMAKKVSW